MINRVTFMTAQMKLLHNFNREGLPNRVGIFQYRYWLLCNLKEARKVLFQTRNILVKSKQFLLLPKFCQHSRIPHDKLFQHSEN